MTASLNAKAPIVSMPSIHFDDRSAGMPVDTIVIHSLYALGAPDRVNVKACCRVLDEHKVSAHYVIARDGALYQLVAEDKRAWHAGVSKMPWKDDFRPRVNDFSIGIELVGEPSVSFTEAQYVILQAVITEVAARHPIKNLVGHEHIAPERKTDPGAAFDWPRMKAAFPGMRYAT
jgi:AmpD protein